MTPVRDRSRRSRSVVLAAIALIAVAVLSGCQTAGTGIGTPPPGAIVVSANYSVFEQASVQAPANQAFTIWFENRENVPHNVRVVQGTGANVALGQIFNGPAAQPLNVPSIAPATYKLRCDVHPDMLAELVAN
ncbi:MAG: cupredoxin domain-containing protein [Chloroflexota bacterium]